MLLKPMVYELVEHPGIQLARRHYDGKSFWAIFDPLFDAVMNNRGDWEWEPRPSERTGDFLRRTRFRTPEAALSIFRAIHSRESHDEVLEKILIGGAARMNPWMQMYMAWIAFLVADKNKKPKERETMYRVHEGSRMDRESRPQ